jgi:hypothetical protein
MRYVVNFLTGISLDFEVMAYDRTGNRVISIGEDPTLTQARQGELRL